MLRFKDTAQTCLEVFGIEEWDARRTLTKPDSAQVIEATDDLSVRLTIKDHDGLRLLVVATEEGGASPAVDAVFPLRTNVPAHLSPVEALGEVCRTYGEDLAIETDRIVKRTTLLLGAKLPGIYSPPPQPNGRETKSSLLGPFLVKVIPDERKTVVVVAFRVDVLRIQQDLERDKHPLGRVQLEDHLAVESLRERDPNPGLRPMEYVFKQESTLDLIKKYEAGEVSRSVQPTLFDILAGRDGADAAFAADFLLPLTLYKEPGALDAFVLLGERAVFAARRKLEDWCETAHSEQWKPLLLLLAGLGDEEGPLILMDKWERHLAAARREELEHRRWQKKVDDEETTGSYRDGLWKTSRDVPRRHQQEARMHREAADRIEQVFNAWEDIWGRHKHSLKK